MTHRLFSLLALVTALPAGAEIAATLHADQAGASISRHLYGHFAEHLGGCIYGGIWVGEDSAIPNTRGIRNDVAAALTKLEIPNLRWPGGCYADRIQMANIAQTVNVLQAMIITEGPKMLRTPTYHLFDLYKPHKDAAALPLEIDTPEIGPDNARVPAIHGTASKASDGSVTVSLVNLDPDKTTELAIKLDGITASSVTGRILTAETMNAHNTFEAPDAVAPKNFDGAKVRAGKLTLALPAKSVVSLTLRQ